MRAIRKGLALLLCLLFLLALLPASLAEENPVSPTEEAAGEPAETGAEENPEEPAEDVPAFVAYGLEKYLREISTGETFRYRTSGYRYGKTLPKKKAEADVTARWAVFYKKGTEKADRDLSNVYLPEGVKPRYVALDAKRMKAAAAIEKKAGEGYEWRGIELKVKYTSYPDGYYGCPCMEDYYDIILHDDTCKLLDSQSKSRSYWETEHFKIRVNGEKRTGYRLLCSKGDGKGSVTYDCFYYVPKGYDGCVFGLLDRRQLPKGWKDGTYVFDYVSKYTLLFRLD